MEVGFLSRSEPRSREGGEKRKGGGGGEEIERERKRKIETTVF